MADQENVMPREGESGFFNGYETRLEICDCGCGRPLVFYANGEWNGKVCIEQTLDARGDDRQSGILALVVGVVTREEVIEEFNQLLTS